MEVFVQSGEKFKAPRFCILRSAAKGHPEKACGHARSWSESGIFAVNSFGASFKIYLFSNFLM
jgi:hypothetical protein